MSTWAQPQLKSDFLLLKHVKTEKPDDKALCWSPGLVIQASAQVLQILNKRSVGFRLRAPQAKATVCLFQDMCGIQGTTQAINNALSPLL